MLRVNKLSPEEIRGLYRVRAALEGLAVRTIIDSPTRDASVEALRSAVSQLADSSGDFAAHVEADLGFHLLLCQLADNPMLVESWKHLEGRIRVSIMSHDAQQLPRIMSLTSHSPNVDAIAVGDVQTALDVVEQHMARAAETYAPV